MPRLSKLFFAGFCLLAFLAASSFAADLPSLPAFPGAEGFGAAATGGRGGAVYHVTNLNDSGPGSFRDSVSKPGRTVVFDVGGVIKLASDVDVSNNITIAGQTAPGDGICLYGNQVGFSNHNNIIVRYIRFRQGIGGQRGQCSIRVSSGSDMIFDHCSIQWGRWDCLGLTVGTHDLTLQYCMIGEGLDPQRFGALIDTVENVTISHNLWQSLHSRNPKCKGTIQYINNVVYNWGITGLVGGHSAADHQLDVINNYFIAGPSSNKQAVGFFTPTDHVFSSGNLVDLDKDGKLNGREVAEADYADHGQSPTFVKTSWGNPRFPVTVDSADEAYAKVIAAAGCSLHRDSVDLRLIDEVKSLGTKGKIIDKESDAGGLGEIKGGTPAKDSAGDGIPDAWKAAHGMNPNDPADGNELDQSGYTMLEVYLNSLVEPGNLSAK
jgi:pectate lyase